MKETLALEGQGPSMSIKCLAFLIPLFLLQNSLGSQPAALEQQKRGQTDNVQKTPNCIHNGLLPEERERMLGEIREFLWERWKGRQSGQVRAVFYTPHGDPTSSIFSIEQDRKGRWRVRVNSVSSIFFGYDRFTRRLFVLSGWVPGLASELSRLPERASPPAQAPEPAASPRQR